MLVSVSFQWRLRRCKFVDCTHPRLAKDQQTFRSDALKDLYNILGETMYRDRPWVWGPVDFGHGIGTVSFGHWQFRSSQAAASSRLATARMNLSALPGQLSLSPALCLRPISPAC